MGYTDSANENGSISNASVLPKHPAVPPNGIVRIVVRSWAYPIRRRLLILGLRRNDLSLLLFFSLLPTIHLAVFPSRYSVGVFRR